MAERVKVLYVIERLARAGTELHLVKILQRLDRSRFEPVLCCLNDSRTDKDLLPEGVRYHSFQAPWNLARPAIWRIYRRLCGLMRREKPDLVHSFLFVANVLAPFAAGRARVKGVVASRGRMGIEWKASVLHRLAQRAADRRTDYIICKTEAIAREIAQVEKAPTEKIRVIPNGVDTEYYSRTAAPARVAREQIAAMHGVPRDGPLILAVGNLKPIKGQTTLIEATALLVERFPLLQVAIVGEGESELDLRAAIRSSGLAERVHLPGAADDVRPWMRAADLFVAPSLSEGMPNAVLEAMAMGLPVILSNIPGHAETAGAHAWYFEPRNSQALAESIATALDSPEACAERARAGTERVQKEFSLGQMVKRIESLYLELLAGDKTRAGAAAAVPAAAASGPTGE